MMTPIRPAQMKRQSYFYGVQSIADYQLKTYGLLYAPAPEREAALTEQILGITPTLEAILSTYNNELCSHQVGYAILHMGEDSTWLLCGWWVEEAILLQRIYRYNPEQQIYAPFEYPAIGCVWELGIVNHERAAWLRHVLYSPTPDIDSYLKDTIEGLI